MKDFIFVHAFGMSLRQQISKGLSKELREHLAAEISADRKLFTELMELVSEGDTKEVQRASWVMRDALRLQPARVIPYLPALLAKTEEEGHHPALRRNVAGLLETTDIPEDLQGQVMDMCFRFLADPKEAIAVRCSAMTVLGNLAVIYPEIKGELHTIIEDVLEHEPTPALRARAKQVLKQRK